MEICVCSCSRLATLIFERLISAETTLGSWLAHIAAAIESNVPSHSPLPYFSIPRPGGKYVRFGAGRSGVRISYQDLVHWYCRLLIRQTMCGIAAWATRLLKHESNVAWSCKQSVGNYKTTVVFKRHRNTISKKSCTLLCFLLQMVAGISTG